MNDRRFSPKTTRERLAIVRFLFFCFVLLFVLASIHRGNLSSDLLHLLIQTFREIREAEEERHRFLDESTQYLYKRVALSQLKPPTKMILFELVVSCLLQISTGQSTDDTTASAGSGHRVDCSVYADDHEILALSTLFVSSKTYGKMDANENLVVLNIVQQRTVPRLSSVSSRCKNSTCATRTPSTSTGHF